MKVKMQFVAKAKAQFVRYSPYKLRPVVDVIRKKSVINALNWLATCQVAKADLVKKVLLSACANAQHERNERMEKLVIKEIRVDEGRRRSRFKPGAMGRSSIYVERTSHISVVLGLIDQEKGAK